MKDYWRFSKQRADNWHVDLRHLRLQLDDVGASRRAELWGLLRLLIEDILACELLTRVMAGVCSALEKQEIDLDSAAIATNVFSSHLEIRHRCLQLLLVGQGLPVDHAVEINRLRFALEVVTDFLLARIGDPESVEQFCFSSQRTREYIADCASVAKNQQDAATYWSMMMSTIRRHLHGKMLIGKTGSRASRGLHKAALAAIRPNWFRAFENEKSLCALRIENIVGETNDLVWSAQSTAPPAAILFQSFESMCQR